MRWSGNKEYKEAVTHDGYLLKVKLIKPSKFWWALYKKNTIIDYAKFKNEFPDNIQSAQAKAKTSLIRHLKKISS